MSFYTPFAFVKSPTSAFVGLLDNFPGAFMAYSLRRLSGTYTGPAIQVIKVDNATTQDIGFTANGNLDTGSISSFLGGASGFVSKWYDQSGNGYDLTRGFATTQPYYGPIIYSSGSTVTINNEPALYYNNDLYASQVELKVNASFTENTLSTFIVAQVSGSTDGDSLYGRFISIQGNDEDYNSDDSFTLFDSQTFALDGIQFYRNSVSVAKIGTYNTTKNFQLLVSSERNGGTANIRFNTSSIASGSTDAANFNSNTFAIGNNGGYIDSGFQGYFQEVIYYKTLQTANSASILNNINDYYSIY